jgi:DinB superfamily
VTEDERTPAAYAADIEAARDQLIAFAAGCSEEDWRAAPLDGDGDGDGDGDPRPVAVVVDHVADSYEYMAGWIRRLLSGEPVEVTSDMVDDLNAEHASGAATMSQDDVAEHLRRSGRPSSP